MHVEKKSELRSLLKSGDKRCKLVEPRNTKSCVWRFFNLVSLDDRIEPFACCKTCGDLLSYSGKTGTGSLLRHRCLHTPNVRISTVWQHYDVNEECENFAICRYCGNNISRGGMASNLKGNNTTNLWTHLRHKHSDEVLVNPIQSQKSRTPVTIRKEKTVRISKAKQSLPFKLAKPKISLEANTSSATDIGALPQKWENYDQSDEIGEDIKDIIYNEDPLCYSPIQVVEEEMIDTREKVTTVLNPTSTISRSNTSAGVTPIVSTSVSSAKTLKNNLEQSIDRLTSVSEQLTYIIQQNNEEQLKDDDYYFANSIIPSMRQLSVNRKLYVRSKIQELLFKECEANSPTKQE